jgi:hypothetical protein
MGGGGGRIEEVGGELFTNVKNDVSQVLQDNISRFNT